MEAKPGPSHASFPLSDWSSGRSPRLSGAAIPDPILGPHVGHERRSGGPGARAGAMVLRARWERDDTGVMKAMAGLDRQSRDRT
jgi:hypothetical protein